MKTVLVTGATGMIGACICERLIKQGDKVRTIARSPEGADAQALRQLGVEVIAGDISNLDGVQKATEGCDGVIHSAALRGLPGATVASSVPPNLIGSINVLTAAYVAGGMPVVQLVTSTFFDMFSKPQSEFSPLDLLFRNQDPYSVTKRLAYLEGYVRVVEAGQDIRFMMPGAAYGPSPCPSSAMTHPNFNTRFQRAILGDTGRRMPMPMPFVLADDCAYVCVAALDKGAKGERYMAMGRQEDVDTLANVCNLACDMAGVPHRVAEVPKERLDDPEVAGEFGATMVSLCKKQYPVPYFDSSFTEKRLGYVPTPLNEGLILTLDWMRRNNFI